MTHAPDAIGFWMLALPAFGLAAVTVQALVERTRRGRRWAWRALEAIFGKLPEGLDR